MPNESVPPPVSPSSIAPSAARDGDLLAHRRTGAIANTIFANLHDHVFVMGAIRDDAGDVVDWRCLEMDERLPEWLGAGRETIASRTVSEHVPERFRIVAARWLEVLVTGRPVDYELSHSGRDYLVRIFRIDPDTIGAAATDVTGLKRAEDALRSSEARFRALTEKSVDMIALVDAEGVVRYWSPGATAVLGWSGEEMVGRTYASIVHPDDLPAVMATFTSLTTDKGTPVRATARVCDRDGAWHLVEGISRNLLDDPDLCGIVVNAHDITRQRELERQFLQAQKLESVGRLAGGVAHDFNNLLTVILNCAGFLELDRQEGRMPNAEHIESIRAAGERAGQLTRQLLAFARKQVIAPVVLDLNTVVRASESLLLRVLGEDVELVVKTQAGLWPVVGDRGQIEQALMNLVVNARDAMPDGGRLEIETRCVETLLDATREHPRGVPGKWVQLIVRDSGTGMTDEVKAHLFEPFFTTKEQGKGTGLGLATVHGIVSQSGGHIRVVSEPGQGTRFELSFPRVLAPVAAPEPPPAFAGAGGSETILLIEDDALVRDVTRSLLRAGGYHVLEARSGHEALEVVRRHGAPPGLVMADVVMPGMSGPEVVQVLRETYPGLRALYVSGHLEDSSALRRALVAKHEFLAKPFTGKALLGRVRGILDGDPAPA
jgi:two-component system, cell cycle sensor histidine kinase and response regulator CckA